MIYLVGDTHGDQFLWNEHIDPFMTTEGKGGTILVLGDFGVGFWNGPHWSEEMFYDWLAKRPYTVLFLDGNHENFDVLDQLPVSEWNGGRVHRIRPNILHLMRGEVYCIENHTFFMMGGGYSIDKARREEGKSWWPQEMPSQAEYANARANLEKHGNQVDYILTHTAPYETVSYLCAVSSFGIKGNTLEEWELKSFLDYVAQRVAYKKWFFGHFHIDAELWRNQIVVFRSIRNLDGESLKSW